MKKVEDKNANDDSIDVLFWMRLIFDQRNLIFKITTVFLIVGFLVAILTKNVYTASTTFLPVGQSGSSLKGDLGGLASLAGVNLGSMGSNGMDISPELYPQLLDNVALKKELLNTELTIEGQDSLITYSEYYNTIYQPGIIEFLKKYTLGLPGILRNSLGEQENEHEAIGESKALLKISSEEFKLMNKLDNQIDLVINDAEGYISLEINFPEARAASELTWNVQRLLQTYILDLKTQKSKDELKFLEARFREKELEMNELKVRLAKFEDENIFINTSLAKSYLIELESQFNLSFEVYSELAKNIENQRFQVKKDTPIFTVLKPVSIPFEKSAPNRVMIVIIYLLLGFLSSVSLILGKSYWNKFMNDFQSN